MGNEGLDDLRDLAHGVVLAVTSNVDRAIMSGFAGGLQNRRECACNVATVNQGSPGRAVAQDSHLAVCMSSREKIVRDKVDA